MCKVIVVLTFSLHFIFFLLLFFLLAPFGCIATTGSLFFPDAHRGRNGDSDPEVLSPFLGPEMVLLRSINSPSHFMVGFMASSL